MANVTEDTSPQPPVVQEQKSGSRGCLYGCLAVVIGGILLVLCAGFGTYWWLKGQLEKYTSTEPMEIPTVDYTEEQLAELKGRVDAFSTAIDEGETPDEDLVLTAEEINALIGSDETLRGKVFISIEDGEVSGDVSIPLDEIPGGKGRYFNGSASIAVSMANGVLIVTLTDAEVNGEAVPQEIVDAMAQENLAKDLYNDPEMAKTLRKFESVEVRGDTLILKIRRDQEDSTEEATEEVSEESVTEVEEAAEVTENTENTEVTEDTAVTAVTEDTAVTAEQAQP